MPGRFILELLFKINITLLQCEIVGTKEEKNAYLFFCKYTFSPTSLFKLLLPLFRMRGFFSFYLSSSFWFPWFVFLIPYLHVVRDQVDFLLSHTHRARKDVGCKSNMWYSAFVASILDKGSNIKMSNCCIHLPSPKHTGTSVQGADQQVDTWETNVYQKLNNFWKEGRTF